MSAPGEILTLGLGNFGSLCAAHWCNSLTRYDAEHEVVFSQTSKGGRPRLLMLDMHQPSALKDLGQQPDPVVALHADPSLLDDVGFRDYGSPEDDGVEYADDEVSEEEEEEAEQKEEEKGKESRREETAPMKKDKIFSRKVNHIPWWKYVTVPLSDRTILSCDSQHLNPDGDMGLGAFGYGQNTWSLSASSGGSASGAFPQFYDNVRAFLEDCDRCQGIQVYADCNSAFGGLSASLAEELKDDFGRSLPLVIHAAKVNKEPPHVDNLTGAELDEEEQQHRSQIAHTLKEQGTLNRLWSTHRLSRHFDVYCPLEVDSFFPSGECHDQVSQAAYLSMVTDTALYPCREDGQTKTSDDPDQQESHASHISLSSICGILRPTNGMRVVGLFSNTVVIPKEKPSLWDVMSTHSLLSSRYAACSFTVAENSFQCDAGLVLGHVLSMRGFADCKEVRYPHSEAMLRHVLPLRTTRYHGSLTKEPYPLSVSFPEALAKHIVAGQSPIGTEATLGAMGREEPQSQEHHPVSNDSGLDSLQHVAVSSHLVNTNGCAPYLKSMVNDGKKIQHHRHRHSDLFGYEPDEWKEMMDDVMGIRDEYDHAPPSDDEDEYSGDDNGETW